LRIVGQANPVKKQTAATLSYIQSWNKLQSEIRNRRAFMVTEGRNRKKKQENQMKLEAKIHNLQVSFNPQRVMFLINYFYSLTGQRTLPEKVIILLMALHCFVICFHILLG
jgi:hypothetical protein